MDAWIKIHSIFIEHNWVAWLVQKINCPHLTCSMGSCYLAQVSRAAVFCLLVFFLSFFFTLLHHRPLLSLDIFRQTGEAAARQSGYNCLAGGPATTCSAVLLKSPGPGIQSKKWLIILYWSEGNILSQHHPRHTAFARKKQCSKPFAASGWMPSTAGLSALELIYMLIHQWWGQVSSGVNRVSLIHCGLVQVCHIICSRSNY